MESETRIIKHGIFRDPVTFRCKCGCVYETTDIAVDIQDNHSGPRGSKVAFCFAHCPECFSKNSLEKYFSMEE